MTQASIKRINREGADIAADPQPYLTDFMRVLEVGWNVKPYPRRETSVDGLKHVRFPL